MKIKHIVIFLTISLCNFTFSANNAIAWYSAGFGSSTHQSIANDAVQMLKTGYPDIGKFGQQIISGSETESHNTDNLKTDSDNSLDGGFPQGWWESGLDKGIPDNALAYYKAFKFSQAYIYLGRMCHLIQDQAVPTHAANIKHSWKPIVGGDNIESEADSHYNHALVTSANGLSSPYDYYQLLQTETRQNLGGWGDPVTGQQYWYPAPGAPAQNQDATTQNPQLWGHYGGTNDKDIYSWSKSPNIVSSQLGQAVSYTAGALIAASKAFPPLIDGLTIDGSSDVSPVINIKNGSNIRFNVYENRTPDVQIHLTIDDKDGEAIIDSDYASSGLGHHLGLTNGTKLPYEGVYSFYWDGKLANGQLVSYGQHVLFVRVALADQPNKGNKGDGGTKGTLCPKWTNNMIC